MKLARDVDDMPWPTAPPPTVSHCILNAIFDLVRGERSHDVAGGMT